MAEEPRCIHGHSLPGAGASSGGLLGLWLFFRLPAGNGGRGSGDPIAAHVSRVDHRRGHVCLSDDKRLCTREEGATTARGSLFGGEGGGCWMIPEQYWQILRRWFWIIGLLGLLGGAAGLFLLPMGLGGEASAYDASTTLQVSRFVSFGGTVTAGSGGGGELLTNYTTSIAEKAKTGQFQARLRAALEEDGLAV